MDLHWNNIYYKLFQPKKKKLKFVIAISHLLQYIPEREEKKNPKNIKYILQPKIKSLFELVFQI